MECEVVDHVRYCLHNNEYYIVGENSSTEDGTGYTDIPTQNGEIVIPEKIKNKEVREIGQSAFVGCPSITRVVIFAKLTAIHAWAFEYCENIVYINIPQTVTYIGIYALELSSDNTGEASNVPLVIEFCKGRTNDLFIDKNGISGRKSISIIYPSSINFKMLFQQQSALIKNFNFAINF